MADFVVEYLDPRDLLENPAQFRLHPDRQRVGVRASIKEVGWVDGPLLNRRTGHLIDGHLRRDLAIEEGRETIPVKVVDLSLSDERRLIRMFDPLTMMADTDSEALDRLIAEIGDADLEALLSEVEVPDFSPVGEDEQGRLDERATVTCPDCGHTFTPS
jgi:ParB-like chromosome segregation protein Spo0J